jgi:hypothetical protein
MSSTTAVATCSPTTKARYGDARPVYDARNEGALGNRLRLQLVAVSIRVHPKLLLERYRHVTRCSPLVYAGLVYR